MMVSNCCKSKTIAIENIQYGHIVSTDYVCNKCHKLCFLIPIITTKDKIKVFCWNHKLLVSAALIFILLNIIKF